MVRFAFRRMKSNQAQLTALDNSVASEYRTGATPTYSARKHALDVLTAWVDPKSCGGASRAIVLVSDGVPTVGNADCTYYQNGISENEYTAEIQLIQTQGQAAGVETCLIGVVGSDNPQNAPYDPLHMLSMIAVAGGTAQPAGCVPVSGTPNGNTVNPRGTY